MQQLKERFLVGHELLQWIALDAGDHSTYQPGLGTEFDHGNQSIILIQGDEGPAEVVFWLRHSDSSVIGLQRRWCHALAARPITSVLALEGATSLYGGCQAETTALCDT